MEYKEIEQITLLNDFFEHCLKNQISKGNTHQIIWPDFNSCLDKNFHSIASIFSIPLAPTYEEQMQKIIPVGFKIYQNPDSE